MKLQSDRFINEYFHQHSGLKKLERQLFAHIRELGDLRRLNGFEQVLHGVLADEFDGDLALDLSRLMVMQAAESVIRDPERDITSVPHGISRAERFAAFFEPGCPFCECKVDLVEPEPEVEDDCSCCSMLVREWRAKHAEALRGFNSKANAARARATAR